MRGMHLLAGGFRYTLVGLGLACLLASSALTGCTESPPTSSSLAATADWHAFEGTLTAAGNRQVIALGAERKASVALFRGSLVLTGADRPGVGFRAEAVVLNDTASGMTGRAVWIDERGDQAWSELRGEGTSTGNHISGTFIGGTGRYAGITGEYAFSWRFVLETEDGVVQGQSLGLKGRVRGGTAGGAR